MTHCLIPCEIEEMSETTVYSLLLTIPYLDELYKNCHCYWYNDSEEMKKMFHKLRVNGQIACRKTVSPRYP